MACSKYGIHGNPKWEAVKNVIMADREETTAAIIAKTTGFEEREVEMILNEINQMNPQAVETFRTYFNLRWE